MNQDYQYMVCTWCITYNHAPYILDTLHGFCSQETNFPVINVIIDDCSTDGEEGVIDSFVAKELDISDKTTARHEENDEFIMTFARHKKNKNCFFVIYYYKENHFSIKRPRPSVIEEWKEKAKYVALCEGDDYWIDPLKLQKQVDFLESHPDYALSYTRFNILNQKTSELTMGPDTPYIDFKHQLIQNYIGTLTTIIVAEVYRRYYEEINPAQYKWPMGDFPLWLYVAANHNIHYLPDITSVYRMHQGSASRPTDFKKKKTFLEGHLAVQHFFAEKYNMPKEVTNAIDYKTNYKLVLAHIQYKQYKGIYPYLCRLTVKDVCKCFIHMVLGFVK